MATPKLFEWFLHNLIIYLIHQVVVFDLFLGTLDILRRRTLGHLLFLSHASSSRLCFKSPRAAPTRRGGAISEISLMLVAAEGLGGVCGG